MDKKKTLWIGIGVIVVCLLICGIYMIVNRSVRREATQEEIEAYAPYSVDWTAAGMAVGENPRDFILSMCTSTGEEEIGSNTYETYISETLGNYLYRCSEIVQIAVDEGTLFLSYTDTDGRTVVLSYDDTGLFEKGIYEPETDTFYHELEGTVEVWSKFRSGIQWGA